MTEPKHGVIYLNNWLSEDICDHIQQVWGLSTLDVEGLDDEPRDFIQVSTGDLQRQQHQHRQPVKEVVHCGPCKSPGCIGN